MKHIVFLSPHSDPQAKLGEVDSGGQCVYEFELGKALSKLPDTKVTIYCRKKFNYPDLSIVNKNFLIKRITCGGTEFIPKEQIDPVLDEFVQKVAYDLSMDPPDVVHSHYWDGGKTMLLLSDYMKRSFGMIWTPHSLGFTKRKNFQGLKNEIVFNFIPRIMWENYTMHLSDIVIVSTEDEKQKVIDDYAIDDDRVLVIPPGVSESNFQTPDKQASREKLQLPKDVPIVMTLGRMDKRKGYHHAIAAFAKFIKQNPKSEAVLAIFSGKKDKRTMEESTYLRELKNLADDLSVSKKVLFLDAVDYTEAKYVYGASDVFLCLSEYEPFGFTVLEAMYSSLPVIATRNGGPSSVIGHGKTGWLVDSSDAKTVAGFIQKALGSKSVATKLGNAAHQHIADNYTWSVRALQFQEVYTSTVDTTQVPASEERFLPQVLMQDMNSYSADRIAKQPTQWISESTLADTWKVRSMPMSAQLPSPSLELTAIKRKS